MDSTLWSKDKEGTIYREDMPNTLDPKSGFKSKDKGNDIHYSIHEDGSVTIYTLE